MRRGSGYKFIATILLLAVAIAILASAVEAAASPFEDVPAGTWPYAVVDYFAARGWVDGYQGGLFVGERVLTRYELGLLTGEIVERAARLGDWGMDAREQIWLQLLVKEYEGELTLLGYRLEGVPSAEATRIADALTTEWHLTARATGSAVEREGARKFVLDPGDADHSYVVGLTPRVPGRITLLAMSGRGFHTDAPSVGNGRASEISPGWTFSRARLEPSISVRHSDASAMEDGSHDVAASNGERAVPLAGATSRSSMEAAFTAAEQRYLNGVQFGARARLSLVERATDAWWQPGFPSPDRYDLDGKELRSYDLVLDLGDIRVTSDRAAFWRDLDPSWAPSSAGPVGVTPRASLYPAIEANDWSLYHDEAELRTTTASKAGVDMDLFMPSARLRLGWRYQEEFDAQMMPDGRTTVAGMEYRFDSRAQALAGIAQSARDSSTTRTTQLGLRYALGRDTSVLLGYRLIDFTDLQEDDREDIRTKMATAEFSIRF